MLWGEKECVLDLPVDPKISDMEPYKVDLSKLSEKDADQIKNIYEGKDHKYFDGFERVIKNNIETYPILYLRVPLLKIISVIPSSIYGFYSTKKMNEEEIKEFMKFAKNVEWHFGELVRDPDPLKKYPHITYLDNHEKTYENYENPFNLGISMDSYYLEHENEDFVVHDGSYILLSLSNGKSMTVWDD